MARLEQRLLVARRAACTSHCLVPAVWKHEHVVGVGVHREALRPGRGEVGVGLAGVAELELELGDQVDQGRERSGAAPGRRRSRRPRTPRRAFRPSTSPVSGRPARVAPRVYALSGSTVPSRASRTLGVRIAVAVSSRSASSSESTPPARPGRRGGGGPATPRPSRGRSGRHRSAGRVRSGGVPVGGVRRVAVGAVRVAAVGAVRVAAVGAVGVATVGAVGVAATAGVPSVGVVVMSSSSRTSSAMVPPLERGGCEDSEVPGPTSVYTPSERRPSGDQPAPPGDRGRLGPAGGVELARMLETCTETVLALMNSCLPISPLERPSATSARISPSRAVRVSDAGPSARDGALPWARSRSSSGWAPSRCATSRAWSPSSRAAGGVAGRAQDAGEDGADRGELVDVAEVLEELLGLAPRVDQRVLRRRVDPGQPAGAQRSRRRAASPRPGPRVPRSRRGRSTC